VFALSMGVARIRYILTVIFIYAGTQIIDHTNGACAGICSRKVLAGHVVPAD